MHVSRFGDPIHPHSPMYVVWNNWLLIMMIYPFIIAPVQAGFGLSYSFFTFVRWTNQVALLSDIICTFWVALLVGKTGDHVESRPLHVAKQYLSSWFIFDLLTSLPWEQILPLFIGDTWLTTTRPVAESLDLLKIFRYVSIARRSRFALPSYRMKYNQRSMIVFMCLVMVRSASAPNVRGMTLL